MNRIFYLGSAILILVAAFFLGEQGKATSKVAPSGLRTDGGAITGTVQFSKESPEPEKIAITKDQHICGTLKYSKSLVVSEETRGVKNAVVSLVGVKGSQSRPSVITLDQKNCEYLPHIQAAPIGSRLEILNSDGILHNVHAYFNGLDPQNTVFNKAQPKFLKKISETLDKSGIYHFKCDVHNHMSAVIAVFDHPYYAVTDEDGTFSIDDVAAGSYQIQVWHEVVGIQQRAVHVESRKSVDVSFVVGQGQ